MAIVAKIASIGLVLSIFFGQLIRINIGPISVPPIDIFLFIFALTNIITNHRKVVNKYFLAFAIFSWLTYLINLHRFPLDIKSFLYLLRLNCLISFFIFPPIFEQRIKKFLDLAIVANIIFGLTQYFFWPNLTYFSSQNWDPHLHRLVSTYFDPTFTGIIFLFFLIKIFLNTNIFYSFLVYIPLALTYSRSTLLSLLLVFYFLAKKIKKPRLFVFSFILVVITVFLLPRLPGEGTRLERTSSIYAKIQNYHQAIIAFSKSPVIGHGYNQTYYLKDTTNPLSHSNWGFDGSLVTVLATTGIIGASLFLLGLKHYFYSTDLLHQSLLLGLLCHSLFANSFLYPNIVILLFAL